MESGIGSPNNNKRKRQDQLGNQKEDEGDGSSVRQQFASLNDSFSQHGLVQPTINQQQILQGTFPIQTNLQSNRQSNFNSADALLSAGHCPLLNAGATTLRNLPLSANRAPDSFINPFLSQASQSSFGSYLNPSFSTQAGLLGQGLWTNEAAQAQLQAQAQAQAQTQAQAQVAVTALTPAERGLLMQGSPFGNVASPQQASQLPNLPLGGPASLAIPPEARLQFPSQQQQQQQQQQEFGRKMSPSFAMKPPTTSTVAPTSSKLTGRSPVVLYMPCDDAVISRYQCLARQQMELFEAQEIDVEAGAQGRNRGIVLGQVGIRCRHCSHLYPRRRTKSSTFYPSKLKSIYQTAQNMANTHLTHTCQYIPQEIRDELLKLSQDKKTSAGGGKEYWSDGARILGVYETETYLRFNPHNDYPGARRSSAGS